MAQDNGPTIKQDNVKDGEEDRLPSKDTIFVTNST